MTPTKTVSVVIAAYHAERWLRDCIESVQSQHLPPGWQLEILLGIDGCPSTAEVAQTLNHQSLKMIRLRDNEGTYVTFNTLMQFATGDRICRFDADDVMWPHYLSRHLEATQTVDLSFCWSIYTDERLTPTSYVMAHEFYHPKNGENRRRSDGTFMMCRHVWDQLGGFRPWRCAADTDFIQRAEVYGFKTTLIEEFLFYRRTHVDSITMQPDTNFKSPLRQSYQDFITQHQSVYKESPQTLRIQAITAKAVEYVKV